MSLDSDNCLLLVQSVHIHVIRNLITATKELIPDLTMTFTQDGIEIVNLDKTETTFVNIKLYARKFQKYFCACERIVVCIPANSIFKLINNANTEEMFSMFITNEDYSDGIVSYLGLKFDNVACNRSDVYKVPVFEAENTSMTMPELSYSAVIKMPSQEFQKTVRKLNDANSNRVEIKTFGGQLTFNGCGSSHGLFSDVTYFETSREELTPEDKHIFFKTKPEESAVVQGEFKIKPLMAFTKFTILAPYVEIHMENNQPLVLKYEIPILGEVVLCVSPHIPDEFM